MFNESKINPTKRPIKIQKKIAINKAKSKLSKANGSK